MNTDTTEPAKTLGQLAYEAFHVATREDPDFEGCANWQKEAGEYTRKGFEAAAQAVLQKFLSAGPVSATDLEKVTRFVCPNHNINPHAFNLIHARLQERIAGRHANPVQAEGGWEMFEEHKTTLQKGDILIYPSGHECEAQEEWIGKLNQWKVRRRIPTVQPAVASGSPKDALVPQEPKQAGVADDGCEILWPVTLEEVQAAGIKAGVAIGLNRSAKIASLLNHWIKDKPTEEPDDQAGPPDNPTATQGQGGARQELESNVLFKNIIAERDRRSGIDKEKIARLEELLTASQARVAWAEAGNKSMLKAMEIRDKELAQSCADLEAMKQRAEKAEEDRAINEKHWGEQLTTQSAEHVRQITMDAGTIKRLQDVGFESDLKVQELEKEITALRQERDRSDQDWANAKKECESLRFQLTEANRVLAEARKEVDRLKGEMQSKNRQYNYCANERDAMEKELQLRSRGGVLTAAQVQEALTPRKSNFSGEYYIRLKDFELIARSLNASLQSPWHTIIAGDPASLPQIGDADKEGYVFWKWSGLNTNVSSQWDVRYPNPPDYWMPIPPLPTPKASAEDDIPTMLEDMLRCVLPMAKAWAHEHKVGSNENIIKQAEEVLANAAARITSRGGIE